MNSTEKGNIGEEFVNEIANKSFMEYWCYPGPKDETGDKKEIADLLIVFGDTLIIVSVKNYDFKDLYPRYFRRTIEKAVKQIYGAERKLLKNDREIIIKHPSRTAEKFPREKIKSVYRIIVNLGDGVKFYPFNEETTDEKFITILDKTAFQTIVRELDTIPDFLQYLKEREAFFSDKTVTIMPGEEQDFSIDAAKQFFEYEGGKLSSSENEKQNIILSGTEHDLLASYLEHGRTFSEHISSKEYNQMLLQLDGSWDSFQKSEKVKRKKELDKNSYFLDELVKREVLTNVNEGSINLATALMSFGRFDRRVISDNFFQFYGAYKNAKGDFLARRYFDFNGRGVVFAYFTKGMPQAVVNKLLSLAMDSFCLYTNYKSSSMIMIATTHEFSQFRMGLMEHVEPFSREQEEQIRKDVELVGWFTNMEEHRIQEKEYPENEKGYNKH